MNLQPLVPFAGPDPDAPLDVEAVRAVRDGLPVALRAVVTDYLRACPMVLAWMGCTTDAIDGRFEVAGGHAICSDGRYFWRYEAADYVWHYRVGLPAAFLELGRASGWVAPTLDRADERAVHDELMSRRVGHGRRAE